MAHTIRNSETGLLEVTTTWKMAREIVRLQRAGQGAAIPATEELESDRTLTQRRAARLNYLIDRKGYDAQSAYNSVLGNHAGNDPLTLLTAGAGKQVMQILDSAVATAYATMISAFNNEIHRKLLELGADVKILGLIKDKTYTELTSDELTLMIRKDKLKRALPEAEEAFIDSVIEEEWEDIIRLYQVAYPGALIDLNYKT